MTNNNDKSDDELNKESSTNNMDTESVSRTLIVSSKTIKNPNRTNIHMILMYPQDETTAVKFSHTA
jgi:hypothetical protein